MKYSKKEDEIFKEACNGYGFEEIEQTIDGIYCTGCDAIHKKPTKIYSNGKEKLCKFQVINLYNPEES